MKAHYIAAATAALLLGVGASYASAQNPQPQFNFISSSASVDELNDNLNVDMKYSISAVGGDLYTGPLVDPNESEFGLGGSSVRVSLLNGQGKQVNALKKSSSFTGTQSLVSEGSQTFGDFEIMNGHTAEFDLNVQYGSILPGTYAASVLRIGFSNAPGAFGPFGSGDFTYFDAPSSFITPYVTVVPEPSTVVLAMIGGIGFLFLFSFKKKENLKPKLRD